MGTALPMAAADGAAGAADCADMVDVTDRIGAVVLAEPDGTALTAGPMVAGGPMLAAGAQTASVIDAAARDRAQCIRCRAGVRIVESSVEPAGRRWLILSCTRGMTATD